MLDTLKREIDSFDVISFNVFDTLLLCDVLQHSDLFKILQEDVERLHGIVGFNYIRENEENELRIKNQNRGVALDEIYKAIEEKLKISCAKIKQAELALESKHHSPNPLMLQIFSSALSAGKKILILCDTCLPSLFLKDLLEKNGFAGFAEVYSSSDIGKSKATGELYHHVAETEHISPEKWLHIGNDPSSDVDIARKCGLTAYYYKSLRERYWENKAEYRALQQEKSKELLPLEKEDDSIAHSKETAHYINTYYTQVTAPSEELAVKAEHVSMLFNMSSEKIDNLKEYVIRLIQGKLMFQEFWALKDINFTVKKGEKLGLIGLNGSGKSTTLKVVSGVMKPTKGTMQVNGSIAPLIELGAGFDANLSAQENIYLNGAILGFSHEQMQEKYDEIINFAELRDFENVAIKNYSSGMVARLGFAIATAHVPDILIIDEILSVGDFEFQKKCHRKMRELTERGATVLFVSHSAGDIIEMCDQAVWLDHGNIVNMGEAEYIVGKYLSI